MSDENSHAQGIIAQLRMAEADEELPDEQRERAGERREELEAKQTEEELRAAGITVSTDVVDDICDQLGASDDVRQKARTFARRHGVEESYGRAPSTTAAAAVYLAGLLANEKATQGKITAVSGVGKMAIRQTYREIAEKEGIQISIRGNSNDEKGGSRPFFDKLSGSGSA